MKLKINADIHKVDLTPWARYAPTPYFLGEAGVEPYKLLAELARQLPAGSIAADLGTLHGASAVALAVLGCARTVLTFDIENKVPNDWPRLATVVYYKMNAVDNVRLYNDAALIHLDIDPHDGTQEAVLIHLLKSDEFKGLLVMDDIYLNQRMTQLWDSIVLRKYDATKYGHHSGTGIVAFDPAVIDVEID